MISDCSWNLRRVPRFQLWTMPMLWIRGPEDGFQKHAKRQAEGVAKSVAGMEGVQFKEIPKSWMVNCFE